MECNKVEATRAKEIAEKKMENKDFVGARKIAFKAQQLYPDLENISQMILVCDVHCSAEKKLFGNERDWYGILGIEPIADDASIKKQYRKFALLLHPDKNKFSGAADAFKLIGEAHGVLLDREKRMLHDSKCKAAGRFPTANWAQQPASTQSNVGKQPWVQNNFTSNATSQFRNQQYQQPQQQTRPGFNNPATFWTVCPFCSVKYQFYNDVMNKRLLCQSCKRSFTSYEMNAQGMNPGTNWHRPEIPKQKEDQNQDPFKVPQQSTTGNFTSNVGFQGSKNPTEDSFPTTGDTSDVGEGSKRDEKCGNVDAKVNQEGQSKKPKKMSSKRKQVVESSDSSDTECSRDSEEDIVIDECSTDSEEDIVTEKDGERLFGQNFDNFSDRYPRRSTRSKQHVSYNENLSDDDDIINHSKRSKCGGSFHATEREVEDPSLKEEEHSMNRPTGLASDVEEDDIEVKLRESSFHEENLQSGEKPNEKEMERSSQENFIPSSKSSPISATEPEIYEYPDPDFSDFDKDRKEECFAVGQIWAVYDNLGGMPRFYALIRKVLSPGFKIQITWLEPDPDDDDAIKWVDEGLPLSFGKFRLGQSENTEHQLMFSHLIDWEKGSRRDSYKIYPRKGETWALFKKWDIKWFLDPDSKRKFEFEFVEVLSDYANDTGISVSYLVKARGFACLFFRTVESGMDSVLIPPKEIFRFSHRVPSFQMTGKERKDVPKGSFELDPASLPTKLKEVVIPENMKTEAVETHFSGFCPDSRSDMVEPMAKSEENTPIGQADENTHLDSNYNGSGNFSEDNDATSASTPDTFEIPDPEFYNFDSDKSAEKFQVGQIWALYSDEDSLPKYYGRIKKINSLPEFKLHVTWLVTCARPKYMISWLDKKMPISCGYFKPQKGKSDEYTGTNSFSHHIRAGLMDKDIYSIFPKEGEVWALYKNWTANMTCSDLEICEFDMVEVMEENESWISVLILELVDGFKSVFKVKMNGQLAATMKIPRAELLKFSHQIPAFRLTEERNGSLRGFLELDPAALPVLFFCAT